MEMSRERFFAFTFLDLLNVHPNPPKLDNIKKNRKYFKLKSYNFSSAIVWT